MTNTLVDPEEVPTPEAKRLPTLEREAELEERVRKLETLLSGTTSQPMVGPERIVVIPSRQDGPPLPPNGAVLHPPDDATSDPTQRTWLAIQIWAELKLLVHMYFDPRYRISRTTQFAIPGIALLLVFNYFFFAVWFSVPVLSLLSPILERVLDVLFCVIGYKLLMRELGRYRDVLNYLARYGSH